MRWTRLNKIWHHTEGALAKTTTTSTRIPQDKRYILSTEKNDILVVCTPHEMAKLRSCDEHYAISGFHWKLL